METLAILKGQHERGVCAVDFSGNAHDSVVFFFHKDVYFAAHKM